MTFSTALGGASQVMAQAGGGQLGQMAVGMAGSLLGSLFGGGRRDPSVQFNYMVEIDGLTLGMFTECSGIKWSMQIDEIKEGGVNHMQQHLLGRAQFDPLVLKRGFVGGDNMLFNMLQATFDPNTPIVRKTIHVVVLARGTNGGLGGFLGMNEVGRLTFHEAFVQEWQGPQFATKTNDIAIESITFRYDWLEFHPGGPLQQILDAAVGGLVGGAAGAISGAIGGGVSI